ncbi:TPA: hypothetical protein DIV55_03265 [Patescibacteria group bacterium]|uniref:Uncharacterized protein n=1 Tax=Candidatus Gottesmanbacteria bacterium GW2011_GWA1_43_11 TaxID=1618436 RepID=A0A0G1FBB1_9BACT|nr:MAG: hypothetical protein UV59_C0027G0036 [Candidatus Gottesmanbacteria bacterium GW2011_GWA1_43_11]HCS78738.1 hypothetical protein [Patescibacteria group bacterium]
MTEVIGLSENLKSFYLALQTQGIHIPLRSTGTLAENWLVRGDGDVRKLQVAESVFSPKSGQMASYGVFFGDNISCLTPADIFYVFRRKDLSNK